MSNRTFAQKREAGGAEPAAGSQQDAHIANSPAMLDGLSALARKLATKDRYVVKAIRIVINELNGVDNKPPEYR